MKQPRTLQEAVWFFGNPDNALAYMVNLHWPDGVVTCPTCKRTDVVFLKNQRKWQCKSVHTRRQFSAKAGTVFEDSPIPLEKWLVAVWMLSNCRNGVSSYELARTIGVTQKSAWFMLHRVRTGLQDKQGFGSMTKIGGPESEVEVDETFVGGRKRNMHKDLVSHRIASSICFSLRPYSWARSGTDSLALNRDAITAVDIPVPAITGLPNPIEGLITMYLGSSALRSRTNG